MRGIDWRGITAVVLALGVVAVIVTGAIAAALNRDRLVSSDEIATVATVLGAAVGAVAVYLGGRPHDGGK